MAGSAVERTIVPKFRRLKRIRIERPADSLPAPAARPASSVMPSPVPQRLSAGYRMILALSILCSLVSLYLALQKN